MKYKILSAVLAVLLLVVSAAFALQSIVIVEQRHLIQEMYTYIQFGCPVEH